MDELKRLLEMARIDIKNRGDGNDVKVIVAEGGDCKITKPSWFAKCGVGYQIESCGKHLLLDLECYGTGELMVRLRGIDRRTQGGDKIPLWVDYTHLSVDGIIILNESKPIWHDEFYTFTRQVSDGEKIQVEISWESHGYKGEELVSIVSLLRGGFISDKSVLRSRLPINEDEIVSRYRGGYIGIFKLREDIYKTKKNESKMRSLMEKAYYKLLDEKGAWIGITARIEGLPTFPHGVSGCFISGGARIGKNAVIFQQVTIGSNTIENSSHKGSPVIGDNCYIGAGAKIIGSVRVGNNCRIGANAVVVKDVPDNSVVVSEPVRILHKEHMDNRFYHTENGVYGYVENGKFIPIHKW